MRNSRTSKRSLSFASSQRGFSMVEMLIGFLIVATIAAMAIPMSLSIVRNLRVSGDALSLHGSISMAKMRAAARFTRSRVYADLAARTYRVETWNKAGAGSWVTEGGTQNLSRGVNLGFGTLGNPPEGTQTALAQAPECRDNAGATMADTACIVFNSRGIPVDATGAPAGNGALYITDSRKVCGVTVSATGLIRSWRTYVSGASWQRM